ncbi:MAG: transglutaminase-like domain-containing protein [Candidatus Bathyarchaeia archaeon]
MTRVSKRDIIKGMLRGLPEDIQGIVEVVQGNLIHLFWAERMGEKLTDVRRNEVNIRSVADMLRIIYEKKPALLTEHRSNSEKLVGNCRDFTVLAVSLLREVGVPARARCGFSAYFGKVDEIEFMDHWVVEYWDTESQRWVMVDSQLDKFQLDNLDIRFDPFYVPADKFLTAGSAWQMCRSGAANPDSFGLFDIHGFGFIKGNMIRDLAALNKMPLLPWDCWGLILEDDESDEEMSLLDNIASVTIPYTRDYENIHSLYTHPDLTVPNTIISWEGGKKPTKIKLSDITETH